MHLSNNLAGVIGNGNMFFIRNGGEINNTKTSITTVQGLYFLYFLIRNLPHPPYFSLVTTFKLEIKKIFPVRIT